jgi:hypothetical protein
MNYHEIIINNNPIKLIPLGDCACGCGAKTFIPKVNYSSRKQIKGQPRKFISGHNGRGKKYFTSKGKRRIVRPDGYIHIRVIGHHRANSLGYISEHIVVMENAIGRFIKFPEVVHHIDENKSNNYVGNLMLFATREMHINYHKRLKAFQACGHYDWRQCALCHKWDDPKNLWIGKRNAIHRECGNEQMRQWRKKNV